jgi:predicted membrane protein
LFNLFLFVIRLKNCSFLHTIIFIELCFLFLFSYLFDDKIDMAISSVHYFFFFYPTISSFFVLSLSFSALFCQSDSSLFYTTCGCVWKKQKKKTKKRKNEAFDFTATLLHLCRTSRVHLIYIYIICQTNDADKQRAILILLTANEKERKIKEKRA